MLFDSLKDQEGKTKKKKPKKKKKLNGGKYSISRLELDLIDVSKEVNKKLNQGSKIREKNALKKGKNKGNLQKITVLNSKGLNVDSKGNKFKYRVGIDEERGDMQVIKREVKSKPSKIKKSNQVFKQLKKKGSEFEPEELCDLEVKKIESVVIPGQFMPEEHELLDQNKIDVSKDEFRDL